MILQLAADQQGRLSVFVTVGNVELQFKLIRFRVLAGHGLIVSYFSLQRLDLGDRPAHGDLKRLHGAFQALEEIHFHHPDEEGLALFLGEWVPLASQVILFEFIFHIESRVE